MHDTDHRPIHGTGARNEHIDMVLDSFRMSGAIVYTSLGV